MQIKLFTIPITDNGDFLEEMNRFLRANKILKVENQLVSNERGASWCFCVKYLPMVKTQQPYAEKKKDYKNELSEEVFKVFSRLRVLRKQIAADDAVPAYAVCTDHELAQIACVAAVGTTTRRTAGWPIATTTRLTTATTTTVSGWPFPHSSLGMAG